MDYSNYPDCRPEYLVAFESMANLGTVRHANHHKYVFISAPLLHLSKSEIILEGLKLGVDYSVTISCYDPDLDKPCGRCDACLLRYEGFAALKMHDPAVSF